MAIVGSEQPETIHDDAPAAPPEPVRALVVRERYHEAPQVLSTAPTIPALLQAARRRWKLCLFLGLLVGGGAAAGVWFSQAERFIARALVVMQDSGVLGPAGKIDARTHIAYVRTRVVLNAALRDPKVTQTALVQNQIDPLVWLEREIMADFSIAPEILRIQLAGQEPGELIAIVNAVRQAYLKEVKRREGDVSHQRLTKLNQIYDEIDQKLQEKKRVVKRMAEDTGSTKDTKIQERRQELYWKSLGNLDSEMLQLQTRLSQAKMELDTQQGLDPKSGELLLPPGAIDQALAKDEEVLQYEQRIANYDRLIEQVQKTARDPENEPVYKRYIAARASAKGELVALQNKLRKEVQEHIREQVKGSKDTKEKNILVIQKQIQWIDEQITLRHKSFQEFGKRRVDVEYLQEDIKLEDDLARRIAIQRQLLQIEMQAPERYQAMDEPYSVADTDTRLRKAGMAGGGAFALIVFGIAFLEFRSRRVNHVDEIVRGLKMRLVGAFPTLPARARNYGKSAPKKEADLRWQNRMAESVESARTMILHTAQNEPLRVIAVTSAVGGEGKTLTCSHLAASLARSGRQTLLIDADLRRPSLQKLFNLNTKVGFSELLRGETDLAAAVQTTPIAGLSIISAGQSDDRAVQALSQPRLAEVINQVRGQYDFVIVDTAPVLPVADSQIICQQADGVIFAILRDVSRLPQIYSAHERLRSLRVRVLGAIVNGTDGPVYGSSYDYSRDNHANAGK